MNALQVFMILVYYMILMSFWKGLQYCNIYGIPTKRNKEVQVWCLLQTVQAFWRTEDTYENPHWCETKSVMCVKKDLLSPQVCQNTSMSRGI